MNLIKRIFGRRDVNLSAANNIFGTMGENLYPILTKMGFIPTDGKGSTLNLIGNGDGNCAQWMGLNTPMMQFLAYIICSPLGTVIDRLAEADINGRVQFIDEDNLTPIKNVSKIPKLLRIRRLLKKPNPWQTWEEFDSEQVVLCKIFGYCPVFAIGPAGFDKTYTRALVNLNRLFVTPIANDQFDIFSKEGPIKEWQLSVFGKTYTIPNSDVFIVKDAFVSKSINDLGLPVSKIQGLDFFVSNICAAMEADNVILKKKGPLGVFSFDPGKDIAGATPLVPGAKDELQNDLARYGLTLGQIQYVISKMPIKWNAMSFNLRDLMTKETIRQGIDGICDRFGYPAELMSGKNATYENRNSSEKWLYNNNVIPFALRRMTRYNDFFELEDSILNKNYNHLPVLQEEIVAAGESYKYSAEGLQVEWMSGMITWNQWQVEQEREPVAGMDIYYPEYIKKFPNMAPKVPTNEKNGSKKTPSKNSGTKK